MERDLKDTKLFHNQILHIIQEEMQSFVNKKYPSMDESDKMSKMNRIMWLLINEQIRN